MRRMQWLLSAGLAAYLTGCVPLPIPIPRPGTDPPFQGYSGFIRAGETTRADVVARFGAPTIKRRGERFFGYLAYQRHGALCFPVLGSPLFPIVNTACFDKSLNIGVWGYPRTTYLLGIEFDDRSIVTRADITSLPSGNHRLCLATGVCLDQGQSIVFASPSEDTAAKRFQGVPDRCTVYVVRPASKDYPNLSYPIRLDDAHAGESAWNTYFLFTVNPGLHKIETTLPEAIAGYRGPGASVHFTCAPGEKVYVHQDGLGRLVIVPESAGKAKVLSAGKILDNF